MVLGIPGYLVFKDWDVQADMPSGDIPGWYWVSRDTKYSRIGVFRWTCHASEIIMGILGYLVFKDWGDQADMSSRASQDGTG